MNAPAPAQAFDAFETHPDPTALLAADGTLLRANPAFRATFRHWIGPPRPPWGRAVPPAFDNDLRIFEAPAPDGRLFEWVERRLSDGARFISARDITRHARAGEEASRAKTTLFATLTHELRTPLNGILGMTGLLGQTALEPAQKTYLAAIRQSGELLLDLITEILDYSRLEAGRVALELAPLDPETVMQDVAELLSPKAHAKGLEIAVAVRADAPLRVMGDDGRLRQILFNLAGNAVKFTDAGGVVLELSRAKDDRLRFAVRDTGPGVPHGKQALIFEEFAQADAGVARRHGGTGLGLAIVKKLAHAMGGEVGLSSLPGRGATFYVDLPLPNSEGGAALPSLAGLTLAVLSTSPIITQSVAAAVRSLGGVMVESGEYCDVLLLDWRADYSAKEVAEFQRDSGAVIALIPQEQREAIARARAAGVRHYTLKPLRRRSLAERVLLLNGTAGASEPAPIQEDEPPPETCPGLRVLLAEDNAINALLARTFLARMGCVVDVAHDGEEAVAAASAAPYDLILLDLRMPRLDGFAAAERIRAMDGPAAKVPLIALTADAGDEEREHALAVGMNAFITKPIDSKHLSEVIARFTQPPKPASV
jgi:signal transduction histidine kinase/CheY-like chemotaxis protein